MLKRRHTNSSLLTLGAMVTALSVLCVFASSMVSAARAPIMIFASVCMYVLTCEGAYLTALLSYFSACAISFLIVPDKTMAAIFALLPGHYGIFRAIISPRVMQPVRSVLKLLYCNVFTGLGLYIANRLLGISIPVSTSVWLIVLIMQCAFIVYDIIYSIAAMVYENRLRRLIMPRR